MKKFLKYLSILIIVLAGIYLLGWGIMKYEQWHGQKRVQELAQELERIEREQYEKKKADTIGGQTPQETLEMFISAVEKGDYELASKYFVIEKQEQWKNHLPEIANAQKIETFLGPLREAKNSEGEYSLDKKSYNIHNPILVSFVFYPSGNWKIEEI